MVGLNWNEGAQLLDQTGKPHTVYGYCRDCDCKFSVAYTLITERFERYDPHERRVVSVSYTIGARVPFAEVRAHAYAIPHTWYDENGLPIASDIPNPLLSLRAVDVVNCVVWMHDETGEILYLAKPGSLGPNGSVGGTPAADLKHWATVCALASSAIDTSPGFEALMRVCEEKYKKAEGHACDSMSSTTALPISTTTTGSKANA